MKKQLLIFLLLTVLVPWAAMAQTPQDNTTNVTRTIEFEDFESIPGYSDPELSAGNMPMVWQYTTKTGSSYYYWPKVCSHSSGNFQIPTSNTLSLGDRSFYLASNNSDVGDTYAIWDGEDCLVTSISLNAWRGANKGTLYLGYVIDHNDVATFHSLQTLNPPVYTSATANNATFTFNNLTIPYGASPTFLWRQNSESTVRSAYLDNVSITYRVPQKHIANNASNTQMTWEEFVTLVNAGCSFEGETLYLDEDITVTTMVGTNETNCFKGTFDGQGHTLTFNYTASGSWYTAPFRYLNGATIKNLKVNGTITANYARCGGLAGHCYGDNTIINCLSNITINSSISNDGTHGGFVSVVREGTTTFEACTFTGRLLGGNTNKCGGLTGCTVSAVVFNNCVFDPTQITIGLNNSASFSRKMDDNAMVTVNNSYYTYDFNDGTNYKGQGKQRYTVTAESPVTVAMNGTATNHNVSHITAYNGTSGLVYNGTIIAGVGDNVSLNLGDGLDYVTDHGTLTGNSNPRTLAMEASNTVISSELITPTNLQCMAQTYTTATLNWTANGTANAWQICLNDDESNLIDVTENPYTLTNLIPNTLYTAKVRANYGGNNTSNWSDPARFETDDKLIVGSGPNSWHYKIPSDTQYSYCLTQQIYTPAEFGEAGDIVSIDFYRYVIDGGSQPCTRDLDIYMVLTDKESFATQTDWAVVTEADRVFSGTVSFVYDWWTTINFSKPFAYDGQHNVLLVVNDKTGSGIDITGFLVYNSTGLRTLVCHRGNNSFDPTSASGMGSGEFPGIKNQLRLKKLVPAALPYTTDFETACDWNLVNGDLTNAWTWGTAAHNGSGTHGLYISNDGGTTNAYTNTASTMVYATKRFNFNAGTYTFSFDWLANGENSWDFLRVVLVPDAISLEAGTLLPDGLNHSTLPAGWIALDGGSQLTQATEWQTVNNDVMIPAAGTYKMVFAWRNDNSYGTNPPAAIDNVSITPMTCSRPTDLHYTATTTTTATLAWTENGEATAWQICLNGDETNPIDVTENPYTFTNLTSATAYTAKVRANCGESNVSLWSNEIGFTTKQIPLELPYATGFETVCDWVLVNGSLTNTWAWGEATHNGEGTHGLYVSNDSGTTNGYDNSANTMVYATKTFNVEAGLYAFSYDWIAYGEYNYDFLRVALVPDTIVLEAGTSRPTDFSNSTLPSGWVALDGGSQLNKATEWQNVSNEVMIPAAGIYNMVFAWRNDDSQGANPPAAIDNVSIMPVTCSAPTGLHIVQGSISGHEVTMAWDNEEYAQYQYAMIQSDFIPETITFSSPSQGNGQTHYIDLDSETSYTFFLRKYCSDDDQSNIVSLTFTTDEACPAPTDLAATEVYGYSAKLDWKASSDSYTVSYRMRAHMTGLDEQFNTDAVPTGWTKYSGLVDEVLNGSATLTTTTSGWNSNSNAFGSYNMKVNIYGDNCKYWLVTPEVNVSSSNTLGFDLALTLFGTSDPIPDPTAQADDRFIVLIYVDDAWTILREWNNAGSDYVYNTIATTGEHVSIDLMAYAGKTVKIAFYGESTVTGNGDNDLHIDNVGVGLPIPAGEWQTVTVDEASAWLTGLTTETPYEAKVQGNCGDDGLSEETALISFTTIEACPVPTELTAEDSLITPTTAALRWNGSIDVQSYTVMYRTAAGISQPVFSEGFEHGLGDWTLRDCSNNTGVNGEYSHTGQGAFRFYYNTTPPQYLISPELSGVTEGMKLEFYYRNQSINYPETFHIGFSSTDNATESFTFGEEITAADTQWHLYSGTIPAGTKYICWKLTSYDKYYLFIDDIAVGAELPAGEWLTATTSTSNVILTGLTSGTKYEAQVKSDCSNPEEWSEAITFATTIIVPATLPYSTDFETACDWMFINGDRPNAWAWGEAAHNGEGTHGLYISNDGGITNAYTFNEANSMVYATKTFVFEAGAYSVSYDWLANGDGYRDFLRVLLVPDTVVFEAGTSLPNSGFNGSSYSLPEGWIAFDNGAKLYKSTEWQTLNKEVVIPNAGRYNVVFAWYNDQWDGTNPPAAIDNVSIAPLSCVQPTNLLCTATTATTATFSWTENYEATAWQICLNDDETDLIDVTENPYTVTGLTSETIYTAKVRANCGDGDVSAWSNLVTFEASNKIVIGSGSVSSSMLPTYVHNNYYQSQQIYTTDELGDAGNIVSIDFFMTTSAACQRNLDIYMVHTDAYAFQTPPNFAWIPVTTADLVFSGTVDFVYDRWTTITLDTPFAYDGQHNVAILVDDNTGGTINANVEFLSFRTSDYQTAFYFAVNTNVDPTTNTSYTAPEQSKNQIRVLKSNLYTTITGYGEGNGGWVLIASPIEGSIAATAVSNIFSASEYDLYRFNPSNEDNEWENYAGGSFNLVNGQGYLYATKETETLLFFGSTVTGTDSVEVPLTYDAEDSHKCWNLVGNPFPCEATINKPYYVLDAEGTGINPEPLPAGTSISPYTAVFVKATGAGQTVVFTKVAQ